MKNNPMYLKPLWSLVVLALCVGFHQVYTKSKNSPVVIGVVVEKVCI